MRIIERFMACILGIIGVIDALIVTIASIVFRQVGRLIGQDVLGSHGVLSFALIALALLGSFVVLLWPRIGAIMLIVAGIGLFFALYAWAILASPQMLIAGVIAIMATTEAGRELRHREERERPTGPTGPTVPAQ